MRSALVTGCSVGLGRAVAERLARGGWRVFAGVRRKEDAPAGTQPVLLDVRDGGAVARAREHVLATVGDDGLDALVNNAGLVVNPPVEFATDEDLSLQLGVNLVGPIRLIQAFLPELRAARGRIVNVSSETGWQTAMPFNGAYATSKHAIECYSDTLRRELMFLDVPVIKIQPGPFKTEMVAGIERSFARAAEASRYFGPMLERLGKLTVKEQEKAADPEIVARVIHTALTARSPRPAYSVKPDLQRVALNVLPEPVVDRLLRLVMRG